MSCSLDMTTSLIDSLGGVREVATQTRVTNEVNKDPDGIKETASLPFAIQRQLSPEEERRVQLLKNLLAQTLAMAQGDPTDEQKKCIREIEAELEKLTGVKTKTRLSSITDKMPGKDEDKREQAYQAGGIDPKEAVHNNIPLKTQGSNPGMQMLRNNSFFTTLRTLDLSELSLSGN